MNHYLENSHYIDWQHPAVLAKALELSGNETDKVNIVRSCFEFVRTTVEEVYRNLPDVELIPNR
jgi:hypothetical protein